MATEYKYDVFISYSRKDYVDETTKEKIPNNVISIIKKNFDDNGITYWIDEDGIYVGDEYMIKIADAIADSSILLFVSSANSNASEWTPGEIGTAHLYKKKIIPFRIDDTPYARSIIVKIASLNYIDYYGNSNKAITELVSAIKAYKDELEERKRKKEEEAKQKQKEEEERRKREEQEKKKREAVNEIKRLATDYRVLSLQQETIVQQLHEKNLIIGKETKECPVCKASSTIETAYCERCGFQFPQLYAIDGNESYLFDNRLLVKAKTNYDAIAYLDKEKARLREKIEELTISFDKISKECEQHLKTIKQKEVEVDSYRNKSFSLSNELAEKQKQFVEESKRQKDELQSRIDKLQQENTILTKRCEQQSEQEQQRINEVHWTAQKRIEEVERRLAKSKSELADTQSQFTELKKQLDEQKIELQSRIDKLQHENAKLTKRSEQSEQEQKRIEHVYKEAQEKIKELEARLSSMESQQTVESDLYDVILVSSGQQKLAVVKSVKELTGLGLKEAKDLVDSTPNVILVSGVDQSTAASFIQELREIGAVVEMRHSNSSKQILKQSPNGKSYRVLLHSSGNQKLAVVKLVKELTGIGLKEAKDLVDSAPYAILASSVDLITATKYQQDLEEAGAIVYVYETHQ